MKNLIKFYHFFGGIQFTLMLIATVAIFVIAGTLIESRTESHRYAARFTYDNPIFAGLLWGFFVNILFSATRRWPFQVRHIPFLITHFGLLMILGGALIKSYFGQQGTMSIIEGGGSHEILKTDNYVIQVEKRGEDFSKQYELQHSSATGFAEIIDDDAGLQLRLLEYAPNSTEHFATWIKGNHAVINGLQPMPVQEIRDIANSAEIPISGKVRFHQPDSRPWHVYALRSDDVAKVIEKLYLQGATLHFTERSTGKILKETSLKDVLFQPIAVSDLVGAATAQQRLNFSEVEGFVEPRLEIEIAHLDQKPTHRLVIPLAGEKALFNQNVATPYFGSVPVAVDVIRQPCLAIIENMIGDIFLLAFDPHGHVWCQPFRCDHPEALLAYEEGYGGYAVQIEMPFPSYANGRPQRETALANGLALQLKQATENHTGLSPPLQLFREACEQAKVDFVEAFVAFLIHWDNNLSWLYPENAPLPPSLETVFDKLYLNKSAEIRQASQWTARLFDQIDPALLEGVDLMELLSERKWPLLSAMEALKTSTGACSPEETGLLLTKLTQQIFSAADMLPSIQNDGVLHETAERKARLFSACLRAHEIHLSMLAPNPSAVEMDQLVRSQISPEPVASKIILETDVVAVGRPAFPEKKLEENVPQIKLQASMEGQSQLVTLAYDRYASGLKWPILDGSYLVRFQPKFTEIPYRLRLRQARQINYANSLQAFSFEADLIVTDQRSGQMIDRTISMNRVHETWDGYRFYLANISPSSEEGVKRVQIVVNFDPAKYWLTYPGAIILTCGIILLFWMRPYKRR